MTPSTTARLAPRQLWSLVHSCVAVALVIASMVALYNALPAVASDTGATQAQLTWIVDGYTLALACLVLPGGALGDRYGRRKAMVAGLVVFAAGCVIPLAVSGPVWLIAGRAVTGVGAALVMPATLSLLTAGFPEERRGFAVGVWSAAVGCGGALGIMGAGAILAHWSWRCIPLAMAVAAVLLAVAGCAVAESVDAVRPAFDRWGAVTSAVAVGLIVVAATEVPELGWTSPVVIALGLGFLLATTVFVVIELRVPHPLLDVRLFAGRALAAGALSITMDLLVTFGIFLIVVQYMELILGFGPTTAAVAVAPMMVPLLSISPIAPWLAQRVGLRVMVGAGLAISGVGMFGFARLTVHSGYVDLLWPLLLAGLGLALSATPATVAIVSGIPSDKHGVAAALNDATREVGSAIGIAISGSVLAAAYSHRIAAITPVLPEQLRGPVSNSLAAALQATDHIGPQGKPVADAAREAFVHGAQQASITLGVLALVAAVLAAVWAPGRGTAKHIEAENVEAEKNTPLKDPV